MSTNNYEMWLTWGAEKKKIQFPVLPETIEIKNQSDNSSVQIVGLGEVTIKKSRKALVFSFSSFFPAKTFPGVKVSNLKKPRKLVRRICKRKEKKKPVHFVLTGNKIDCYCTIESFTFSEDGGDVGTYNYSIELKEYQEVEARKIRKNSKKNKSSKKRTSSKTIPSKYTVKKGDTLWTIAKKYYGSSSKWKKIYNANKKKIGSNPNKLTKGTVLKLPS